MKRTRIRDFLSGMLIAGILFTLAAPAMAALTSKWIQVYTGVNVYVDDHPLHPTDVNGDPVEVFAYNGTTYLPIRAVSDAVGKPVQYDGKTQSVYLGKHTGDKPAVWLKDLERYSKKDSYDYKFTVVAEQTDNLGNTHYDCIGRSIGNDEGMWYSYRINGQYTAISGTLFQPYYDRDGKASTTMTIYGDGERLYTATVRGGSDPIDPISFHVDITGVLELKVELTGYYVDTGMRWATPGLIGECGLWT